MAYVPPHKRHSNAHSPKPTPVPSSIIPHFKQSLTLGGEGSNSGHRRRHDRHQSSNQGVRIVYGANSICRWFTAGLAGDDPLPPLFRLVPFDCEALERRNGAKPLALRAVEGEEESDGTPWVKIADRVMPDIVSCRQGLADALESEGDPNKLSAVARVGTVLFLGNSADVESIRKVANAESDSRKQVRKIFHTSISSAWLGHIENSVLPKYGFQYEADRDGYIIKVVDKNQPDSTISCKCRVANDGGGLEVFKIELNPVRHLVVDVSCLCKDLDLRLMLNTKRTINFLDDEENEAINQLIKSSIVDPGVRGGLRWPLGKESVADRFSVVGVWHIKDKLFSGQTMRIKLRHADRFDHSSLTGEVSDEITLKLTGISKYLREGDVDYGVVKEMLQGAVKLIWDDFLR